MGYMTTYTLKASPVDEELYERIDEVLRTFNNWLESEGVEDNTGNWRDEDDTWYDHEEDMLKVSLAFPEVSFILEGGGECREDLWRKYFQNGKRLYAPAYFTFWPFQKDRMTTPMEDEERKQAAQVSTEPELSDEQVARLDSTDNAVYQCLLTLLNCDEEKFPWDMNYIGEAEDLLVEFLKGRGHRIYRPAIVTEPDGTVHIEDYEEATEDGRDKA